MFMSEAAHRILVVEDQRLIAAEIEHSLKELGYLVVGSVSSGEDAITTLDELRPELVLMDVHLRGEMDGIDAAEIIRDRFNVPVVYLTAHADDDTILRAKKTTPFGYLLKPFNQRELRATIEIAFYTHRMERTLAAEERANRQAAEELTNVQPFRLLVESVEDYAIFILDPSGHITTWNLGAARIKGYTSKEILGKHFSTFYLPEDVASGKCDCELEIAAREGRFEDEGWRIRKDGSRFWANVVITRLGQADEVIGFAKVTRDLTERRKAEEYLRALAAAEHAASVEKSRVQEFQERFLAVLGHDLRNPLASIDMGLEFLRMRSRKAAITRVVDRTHASVLRMSRMIEQILDFTRSRLGGGLALVFAPMDLREALISIVDELRTAHPAATIQLRCPILLGAWDRDRLEQVFSNLIGNALVHGDPSTPVTVTAGADVARVWVEAHNQGPPIPEELQSVLFNPFRRGERESETLRAAGLGLGLYISNEVVLGHGGHIEIRSTVAEGTTFRVVLPRQTDPDVRDGEAVDVDAEAFREDHHEPHRTRSRG
jgi:PAS domain S-box-containing protein